MEENLEFSVHTANLLKQVFDNPGTATLKIPFLVFNNLLTRVAKRASQLNDAELNKLMIKLTLYAIADPHDPEYDPEKCREILNSDTGA